MFKVMPNGVNRLDIEISGKLDADDMRVALDEIIGQSENIEGALFPGMEIKAFDPDERAAAETWLKG